MYGCEEKADGAEFTCGIAWTRAAKRASYLPISYRVGDRKPGRVGPFIGEKEDPTYVRVLER